MFAGIYAVRFNRLFGWEVRQEDRKKRAQIRKAAAQKAAPTIQPVLSAQPAAPLAFPNSPAPVPHAAGTAPGRNPAGCGEETEKPRGDREKQLKESVEAYMRKQRQEGEERVRRRTQESAEELLAEASRRLFAGGEALATLDGQRQLFIWLRQGVPCLEDLDGTALMDPGLKDDPAAFLPALDSVVQKAGEILKEKILAGKYSPGQKDPEQLCAGWYALSMYARMSGEREAFELAAGGIADYLGGHADAADWLRKAAE